MLVSAKGMLGQSLAIFYLKHFCFKGRMRHKPLRRGWGWNKGVRSTDAGLARSPAVVLELQSQHKMPAMLPFVLYKEEIEGN